jgi:transcriptional regulator of heat shock response
LIYLHKIFNYSIKRIKKRLIDYPINEANEKLNKIENYVNNCAIKLKLDGKLSKENLENEIRDYFKPKKEYSFFEFYDKFIKDIETGKRLIEGIRKYSAGSITQFTATKTNLYKYNSKLNFNDFDLYVKSILND